MAKTPHAQCRGPRFDSWSGTRSHILQLRPSTAKQIKYFFKKNQSCNYNFHSNNVKSKQSLAKKKTDKRKYIILSTTAVFYKTGNLVSRKESLSSQLIHCSYLLCSHHLLAFQRGFPSTSTNFTLVKVKTQVINRGEKAQQEEVRNSMKNKK